MVDVAHLGCILHLVLVGRFLWRTEAQVAHRWLGEAHTEKLVNAGAGRAGTLVCGVVEVNERRRGGGGGGCVCGEGDRRPQSGSDARELREEHHGVRLCMCSLCMCVFVCVYVLYTCAYVVVQHREAVMHTVSRVRLL